MQTFSDNEKSRPRPARWSWLPRAALCCFWRGFGKRRGVRSKRTAQNFAFSEFWPFLHLFHVIMKNFYMFLSILIFSVCFILIFEKNAKTPHFRAAFLLCIFFINTSWCRWPDSNRYAIAGGGFWVHYVYQFHHTGGRQDVVYHISPQIARVVFHCWK